MPAPTTGELAGRIVKALNAMAEAGYTAVDEAGADTALLAAFEDLEKRGGWACLSASCWPSAMWRWSTRGKPRGPQAVTGAWSSRSVKAFYDGAMGSRGAFFLLPYSRSVRIIPASAARRTVSTGIAWPR